MIELLGTVMTSVLGGGATGLLGVLLQRFFDMRQRHVDLEVMRLQLAAARETRLMELEAQERMADKAAAAQALQAQIDAQAREVDADAQAYAASIGADRATYLVPEAQGRHWLAAAAMGFVDFVRGLTRPAITAYSLVLLTLVFIWVQGLYRSAGLTMTGAQVHELASQAVGTVFYLAVTTTVWWFGVRPGQPPKGRAG
jgi:hypothetical protein